MKKIGMVSWKGGTGKTTLACNLAERANSAGLKTVLVDFDPTGNALEHFDFREAVNPDAPQIESFKSEYSVDGIEDLKTFSAGSDANLIICDLPGKDDFIMDRLLNEMDLLLLPLSASAYDMVVTTKLIEHCQQHNWQIAAVPTQLPQGRRRVADLEEALTDLAIPIAPKLMRRVAYLDASIEGLGICEYAPNNPGAAEMNELWQWVADQVNLAARKNGAKTL